MSSTGSAGATPTLTDGRVLLRALREDDATSLAEQFADPESRRWTTTSDPFDTEFGARSYLRRVERDTARAEGPRHWAVEWRDGDATRFGGYVDLHPHDHKSAGIDFGLHPASRGRHVMSAAVRLVCRWWFDQGGQHVTWFAEAGNLASWQVVRACGFRFGQVVTMYLPPPTGPVEGWVATVGRDDDLAHPTEESEPEAVLAARHHDSPLPAIA